LILRGLFYVDIYSIIVFIGGENQQTLIQTGVEVLFCTKMDERWARGIFFEVVIAAEPFKRLS
jgi:hypothetical protein